MYKEACDTQDTQGVQRLAYAALITKNRHAKKQEKCYI